MHKAANNGKHPKDSKASAAKSQGEKIDEILKWLVAKDAGVPMRWAEPRWDELRWDGMPMMMMMSLPHSHQYNHHYNHHRSFQSSSTLLWVSLYFKCAAKGRDFKLHFSLIRKPEISQSRRVDALCCPESIKLWWQQKDEGTYHFQEYIHKFVALHFPLNFWLYYCCYDELLKIVIPMH